MYVTFRNMQSGAPLQDTVALMVTARDHLNTNYGTDYAVSINVGGDPTAISLSTAWETLGAYDQVRAAIAGDAQMQSLIRTAGMMLTSVQDTIAQVVKAPAERNAYASVSIASMHMPAVAEAVPFAVEVAEYAEQKTGRTVGVMTAMTGNRSGLMWATFAESLDQIATDNQTLAADPQWLDFFKRSEPLFAAGSLEDSIWQVIP
jgi:hypothetical protein